MTDINTEIEVAVERLAIDYERNNFKSYEEAIGAIHCDFIDCENAYKNVRKKKSDIETSALGMLDTFDNDVNIQIQEIDKLVQSAIKMKLKLISFNEDNELHDARHRQMRLL